jgi:hypothetical protein
VAPDPAGATDGQLERKEEDVFEVCMRVHK